MTRYKVSRDMQAGSTRESHLFIFSAARLAFAHLSIDRLAVLTGVRRKPESDVYIAHDFLKRSSSDLHRDRASEQTPNQ